MSIPRPSILPLPESVINQIAAGEVVERPAAALKEILENSLDAGAAHIRIEAAGGGVGLLIVDDDGGGIPAEELSAALQRHATSKLRTAEELAAIASFGFRGEALAAIASVSRFALISGEDAARAAIELRAEGGVLAPPRPAPPRRGTRVEMRDLFFNAPARRRFLRTPATELSHLVKVVEEAALANPAVAFKFIHEDEARIDLPAQEESARAAAVLGKPVRRLPGAAGISGYLATAETRRLRGELHTFVNRRPVKDRLLTRAVLDALRDLHPDGEQPDLVLFLDLPAGAVDVNVHPQKREVRFARPQEIYQKIRVALRGDSHAGHDHAPGEGHTHSESAGGATRLAPDALYRVAEAAAEYAAPFAAMGWRPQVPAVGSSFPAEAARPGAAPLYGAAADFVFLGQVFRSYFLAAGPDCLYLVDQHALHERALYEKFKSGARFTAQPLLTPVAIACAPEAAERAAAWTGWAALGFAVEQGGPRTLLITAVPAELKSARGEELIELVLATGFASDALAADPDPAAFYRELIATRACKKAIKAFDPLSPAEMAALLEGAVNARLPPACPHGRPVLIALPLSELESRFRRRG